MKISEQISSIYSQWIEGERRGLYFLLPLLYIFSILYGIGVKLRLFFYRIGAFKIRRLNCKVISIGNITVGGSGKTPMTIHLAEWLRDRDKKVAILSRGYKGRIKGIGVVSDGEKIVLGPEDAGDEPYLMAARLKNIPVIVGRDRHRAGMYAIEKFRPDVIILDDGFQHIGLVRDLDIVLIDGKRGFGSGYLFPMGILREPISSLKRASVFMVKGSELGIRNYELRIMNLKEQNRPLVFLEYKPKAVISLADNSRLNVDILKGKKVAALSGIADPKSFRDTIEGLGAYVIKEIIYPDHHSYAADDLNDIIAETEGADMVVVTEKDWVKLKGCSIKGLPVYVLAIDVEIKDAEAFERVLGLN